MNDDQFLYLVKFKLHIPDTKELFKESPTNSEGSLVKIRKESKSPERAEMLKSLPAGVRSIFQPRATLANQKKHSSKRMSKGSGLIKSNSPQRTP